MKLHMIINSSGEILLFCVTSGNTSNINKEVIEKMTKNIYGKVIGDKGYISAKIFRKPFENNIILISKVHNNMKNRLIMMKDAIKRAIIESK